MEDNTNFNEMSAQPTPMFAFDAPRGQSSYIKVIGVGGGGGNAVNHMYRQGITGVDFIVCNTDMKALNASPVPNKIPLGNLGLGAGGKPEKARKAAEAKADEIREALSHNTQMLFITAGMGGGTGTGAAPVIADIAKSIDLPDEDNKKILVVAIVTRPFSFEGNGRRMQAEAGIEELRKRVDSIIIINNDKLSSYGDLTMSKAYALADDVLLTAAKGIAEIISKEGYICRDFQDINSVMENSDRALMGIGSGKGESRAKDAIDAATTSVLLDDSDIYGAKNVLLYFTSSHEHEMTIREQLEITDYVCQATGGAADVKYGAGYDDELGDELKVTLIATGFDKSKRLDHEKEGEVIDLVEDDKNEDEKEQPQNTADSESDMHLIPGGIKGQPVDTANTPVETPKTTPVAPTSEPVNQNTAKRIIPLEPIDEKPAPAQNKEDDDDQFNGGIHLMTPKDEQTAAPVAAAPAPVAAAPAHVAPEPTPVAAAPAPTSAPAKDEKMYIPVEEANNGGSRFNSMQGIRNSEDRIRHIREMLFANPEHVANTMPAEITDSYELPHSSCTEASSYTVDRNGHMVEKPTMKSGLD